MNIEAAKAVLDEMEGVSGDMYDGMLTMHEDTFRNYARRIREALEEADDCSDTPTIGDRCVISDRWEAFVTAITLRSSGQVEYMLEWFGDGELRSDWLTAPRMRYLGIKVFRNGREMQL